MTAVKQTLKKTIEREKRVYHNWVIDVITLSGRIYSQQKWNLRPDLITIILIQSVTYTDAECHRLLW